LYDHTSFKKAVSAPIDIGLRRPSAIGIAVALSSTRDKNSSGLRLLHPIGHLSGDQPTHPPSPYFLLTPNHRNFRLPYCQGNKQQSTIAAQTNEGTVQTLLSRLVLVLLSSSQIPNLL
jgi:hypothetical protein